MLFTGRTFKFLTYKLLFKTLKNFKNKVNPVQVW